MNLEIAARIESWPIAGSFSIARGSRTEALVVVAEVTDGMHRGRGECVPYPRYEETPEGVKAALDAIAPRIVSGELDRIGLQDAMPAGAARNAIDCALWDLEAKRQGKRAWTLAGRTPPRPVRTAFTISLASPEKMAEDAGKAAHMPLLKVKLGGLGDKERLAAVRTAAPASELIVDANEAWEDDQLESMLESCAERGVVLVEQPLPAGRDRRLGEIERPVPVCADESIHDRASLPALADCYDVINIKLDKTGGLTEALALSELAMEQGFDIMVGCMVGTSLAMAPALIVAQDATIVDLDAPLLLKEDRITALSYDGAVVQPPPAALWG